MSKIDVNISEIKRTNTKLSKICGIIGTASHEIKKLENTIDPRVLRQANIAPRLAGLRKELSRSVDDTASLQDGISLMLKKYEEAEAEINRKANLGLLLGSGAAKRSLHDFDDHPYAAKSCVEKLAETMQGVRTGTTVTGIAKCATPGIRERVKNVKVTKTP